ncbi:glycosyltransferase family 4 protein [Falsiroseomonas sp. E2-1-a20]|uniref:glycosyltransferase family 4 protein n=1 Tax=Falsiroseomonas sp. E2-1-a20 TaxID=3239300 RepID=UPI003F3D4CAC
MRILTLNYEYPPVGGGGATACQALAEALVKAGHEVEVVTSGMAGLPALEVIRGVRIHRFACLRRHRHSSTAAELLTTIWPTWRTALVRHAAQPFDLVHCHFVVPSGIVAWLLRRRTGLPYVLTAHGSDVPGYNPDRFELLHRLIAPAWRRILEGAAAVTSPSDFLARLIARHGGPTAVVIPNPLDIPPAPVVERHDRILVVSRLVARKGVQHLIEAFPDLPPGWELVIAGDGPHLPALRALARDRGVPARFLGLVAREELPALYASARLFVLPSLQENFPMVLLEAMQAGCAVVTTRTEGCLEVVGDAAALVEPASAASLRQVLTPLMQDEAAMRELGQRGRARAASFTAPEVVRAFIQLFEHCLAVRRRGLPASEALFLPALRPLPVDDRE